MNKINLGVRVRGVLLAIFVVLLFYSVSGYAKEWLFQAGLEHGGDEIVKTYYDNGDNQTIRGGGLLYLAVGGIFPTAPVSSPSLETQVSVGWKFDSSTAENGDVDWDRFPIELLQFHKTENWRFGGGLTYHLNPKLEGSGDASHIQADFDNALGYVVEVDYLTNEELMIGVRATFIDYEVNSVSVDGNSIGLLVGVRY